MEYIAISNSDIDSLSKRVNELIAKGFEPLNGIAVSQSTVEENNGYCEQVAVDMTYCQAMIKR